MALQVKEFIGSTGKPNLWTWKIIASEESADIKSKTSVVKIESYIGRASSAGASYFRGTATLRYKAGGQQYDGWYEKWTDVNISSGGWYKIGEHTFTVSNTGNKSNPTKITVSGELVNASFSPTSASASGELSLTPLHDAPVLSDVTFKEKNTQLTGLSVADNYFVANLSKKDFTIDAETYDDAKITKYEVIIGDKSYSSTTNTITIDFAENNLSVLYDENAGRNIVELYVKLTDDLGGEAKFAFPYTYVILYTRPTVEKTSTTIKRKTGNGTVLTDNKALLNFIGNCYKGNDVIGNNNKPVVQYKIWDAETSEPASYTSLTTSNVANVAIKDFELSNLSYLKSYKYKIRIYDTFYKIETTSTIKEDRLPTGKSVWTEYKDRVDFEKITVKHKEVSPNEDVGKQATIWLSSDFNFSANMTHTIPFDNIETDAEDYFELSNNGVRILKDCVVQVWLQWVTWGTYSRYAYIYYNSGEKESWVSSNGGTVQTMMILKCKQGDLIQGRCYAEGSNGMGSSKNQSYLELTILK